MKKIKLSEAAFIITSMSEHFISGEALRKQIKKCHWPFWAKKIDGDWHVYLEDCAMFAATFKGFKIGRPHHHIPILWAVDPRDGKMMKRYGAVRESKFFCKICEEPIDEKFIKITTPKADRYDEAEGVV